MAINIAPLVDVVFLLVIFFAVSTTFLETAGLKLELPTSSSTATREPQEITVLLAADGTLSFDGEVVAARATAGAAPRRRWTSRSARSSCCGPTPRRAHGDVVRVMDLIREAGAEGLTVAARGQPDE